MHIHRSFLSSLFGFFLRNAPVNDGIHRKGARSVEPKGQENETVQEGLLKVVRVVGNVSKGESLGTNRWKMKVDSGHHGDQKGKGRWSGQKSKSKEDTSVKLGIVVNGRPEFQGTWQEGKVWRHDVIDKALEFRSTKIGWSDATYRLIIRLFGHSKLKVRIRNGSKKCHSQRKESGVKTKYFWVSVGK